MSEDFQEEDVWGSKTITISNHHLQNPRKINTNNNPSPRRLIPKSVDSSDSARGSSSSAPVSIPDWSKILKKPRRKKNLWDDEADSEEVGKVSKNEDEEEEEEEMVPPHEYLARRMARTQIASFSMCEGIGRTLKGRDLSTLRNAILAKTGFLEQQQR